jgi:hypothetical protein
MTDNNYILGPSSSPDTSELTKALAKAQSEYKHVRLDDDNPHFKSKFSSYATCCDSLRGPLTKNGLALPDFRPGMVGGQWVLVGTLRHSSGQYITGICPLWTNKQDMQGLGAAITYGKRTLLMALVGGFSGEPDDDGNSVSEPQESAFRKVGKATVDPDKASKALVYQQTALDAIAAAESEVDARKALSVVELRVREKVIPADVFRRCKEEVEKKYPKTKEVVHG